MPGGAGTPGGYGGGTGFGGGNGNGFSGSPRQQDTSAERIAQAQADALNAQRAADALNAQRAADAIHEENIRQVIANTDVDSPIGNLIDPYSDVTGVEGPPRKISGPQVLPGADPHGDFETEPRLGSDILTEGDIGYETPYDYPEYDEKGNIIKYEEPVEPPREGDTYVSPVTQADVTPPADTGLTDEEKAAAATTAFQASVEAQKAANLAASPGLPFRDYYVGGAPTAEQVAFMQKAGAAPSTVGLREFASKGGIMGTRQPFGFGGLGKVFKKAAKAVKSIAKSPVGMAALTAVGLPYLSKFGVAKKMISPTSFLGTLGSQGWTQALMGQTGPGPKIPSLIGRILSDPKKAALYGGTAAALSPFLMGQEEEEEKLLAEAMSTGKGFDPVALRAEIEKRNLSRSKYPFMPSDYYAAEGGRAGYAGGLLVNDEDDYVSPREAALAALYNPQGTYVQRRKGIMAAAGGRIGYYGGKGVASLQAGAPDIKYEGDMRMASGSSQEDMLDDLSFELYGKPVRELTPPELKDFWDEVQRLNTKVAQGGRIGAQEGGLMNLGGMEKDYRQEGGFVPIGGEEKADDVPARLSKNEFVFTADAVRAAGDGDIDRGAEVMENLMENLEAGGKVSEDSQGLEGARNMFANTQRLENRII